ncbi:MAG: hypothetical protein JXD22_07420 [Sedimentisphaerales bacterium]|nr:hypothetical protein [Sedimentisphaerales bacterium]
MKASTKKHNLFLESLEPRRLLSGIWQGFDVDGDEVTITLSGPGDFLVYTEDEDLGQRIDTIELYDTSPASRLMVTARYNGGDGYVDVDAIDAAGLDLRQIVVDGNLGDLIVNSVRKVVVFHAARSDGSEAQWLINNSVRQIRTNGSLDFVNMEIAGNLNTLIVQGDIAAATLTIDGRLRKLMVYGDIADQSDIYTTDNLRIVNVFGYLDNSVIETEGLLQVLYVGLDVFDSSVYADYGINKVIIDGGMENSFIGTAGKLRIFDAWNWVISSEIVAGPQGINRFLAYDLSDTAVSTPGYINFFYLDAQARYDRWDNIIVEVDDGWYWPIYDVEYLDYVYVDNYYDYYYVEDYYDIYYYDAYYDDYYYGDYYYEDAYYDDYITVIDSYPTYGSWYIDVYW